ncbi:MAG: YggU family protein [Desulfobacterales bacterium]|nr:MAG: YggU family protein [Desulfobacterales bacterium]
MISIRKHPQGIIFKVFVQPRSSKNMIVGLHDDALKIKLTAPPVDNAANKMTIKFLAKSLGVSNSLIEIIAGHTSRTKQVLLRAEQSKITEQKRNHLKNLIKGLL